MLFVKSDELKAGARLAKPIYNKNGVLLYDRNTILTEQGIYSIRNFGLIGIYILEPAEPVPPMTEEDIEFERFQTMSIFMLKEDMDAVINGKEPKTITTLVNSIIKNYGNLNHKITFIQNIRSKDDHIYKHSLNVGILCTLIAKKLNLSVTEKQNIVMAGLYHDLGKLIIPKSLQDKGELTPQEEEQIIKYELDGLNLLNDDMKLSEIVKDTVMQFFREKTGINNNTGKLSKSVMNSLKILKVANDFDKLTAMSFEKGPSSEIAAIRYMLSNNKEYDEDIVRALLNSINLLIAGTTVELTNGRKGIVLVENKDVVLRPAILDFTSNTVLNLNQSDVFSQMQIKDIMKTMDNRYVINRDIVNEYFKSASAV